MKKKKANEDYRRKERKDKKKIFSLRENSMYELSFLPLPAKAGIIAGVNLAGIHKPPVTPVKTGV